MIELITKDKNEKSQFAGRCKLSINSVSKMLLVEPFNEEYKMISAMFKWQFVSQKNFLVVFAEHDFQDFAIIFDDTRKCDKTCDFLFKKGATTGNKELIHERFLPALFRDISENSEPRMKEIITNWIKQQDEKEKEEYIQLFKNHSIDDMMIILDVDLRNNQRNLRKRKPKDISYSHHTNDRSGCTDVRENDEKHSQGYHDLQKQGLPKGKRLQLQISLSSSKINEPLNFETLKYNGKEIVEASNFKIFKYDHDGVDRSKLVVFTSSDIDVCYEYSWDSCDKRFRCCACKKKNQFVFAKVHQHSNGSNYLTLGNNNHSCEPCKYIPEKYEISDEIIENSEFKVFNYKHNGKMTSRLVLFCPSNKNLCYEYCRFSQSSLYRCCHCPADKGITAIVCRNGVGKEYLMLSKVEHVCELREFDAEKYKDDIIVAKPMYEITLIATINSSQLKVLNIFTSSEKKYYFKFFYSKFAKKFYCPKCRLLKFNLHATIQNEGKENECVFMGHQKHVCEPMEYFEINNVIMAPNYQLINRKLSDKVIPRLAVFTNDEKSECYEYTWERGKKLFLCRTCSMQHKIYVYAKIVKNDENEECVYLSEKRHKCNPIKFLPENIIITKIVKQPNYQLLKRKHSNRIFQHLAVFTNDTKDECYEYTWSECSKYYVCNPCKRAYKIRVFAKIIKNAENEECVECGKTEHKCSPIKYIPEQLTGKTVSHPNFKLWEEFFRKKKMKRLTIFDPKNKNYGYIYTYNEKRKCYKCIRCQNIKVTAKLLQNENGENYLELNNVEHICEIRKL